MAQKLIRITDRDNVAVALESLPQGSVVEVENRVASWKLTESPLLQDPTFLLDTRWPVSISRKGRVW